MVHDQQIDLLLLLSDCKQSAPESTWKKDYLKKKVKSPSLFK